MTQGWPVTLQYGDVTLRPLRYRDARTWRAVRRRNAAWLLGPLTGVTGNAILAAIGRITVTTAFATWIAGQILGLAIMVAYAARRSGFGRFDLSLARRALSFGLRTHPGRLMGIGNYRADQWLVGSISGSRALGLYSVPRRRIDLPRAKV